MLLKQVCPQWVIFHEIVFDTGNHIGQVRLVTQNPITWCSSIELLANIMALQVMEVRPEWLLEIAPHIYKKYF